LQEPLLDANDVADRLKLKYRTILRMTERGELPGFKIAGEWRYKESEVEAYIEDMARKRRAQDERL
jgi:excisionase family DNA binding protein